MKREDLSAMIFVVFLGLTLITGTIFIWVQTSATTKMFITSVVWLVVSFIVALALQPDKKES